MWGLDSEESSFLNCPLHLLLTHCHGDLIPHGQRGSKWRWRQARKAALTSSWQYCCNLQETPWSWGRRVGIRKFLVHKTAAQRHCEAEDKTQEGAWGENTDGFCETVLCYVTTTAKHSVFKMSLHWILSTKCSLRAALQLALKRQSAIKTRKT